MIRKVKFEVVMPGGRKRNAARRPVDQITDRAKRYRANTDIERAGPRCCGFCGGRRDLMVDHIDGNESNGAPYNLLDLCRRCNTAKGYRLRNAGLGVRTRQYNPGAPRKRATRPAGMSAAEVKAALTAYGNAVKVMRGSPGFEDGNVAAAVKDVQAAPAWVRSLYTSKSWKTRRTIYGKPGRDPDKFQRKLKFGDDDVPF